MIKKLTEKEVLVRPILCELISCRDDDNTKDSGQTGYYGPGTVPESMIKSF